MLNIEYEAMTKEIKLSDEARTCLTGLKISDDSPGTILRDFETLLEFVGDDGTPSAGKHCFLPMDSLRQLNAAMRRPLDIRLKRPQQRSYYNLHGLYLLLRSSGLGVAVGTGAKGRLELDAESFEAYRNLNATEQYFTLIESWLLQSDPAMLGERGGWGLEFLLDLKRTFEKLGLVQAKGRWNRGSLLYGTTQFVTAALMEMFGWARLEYDAPSEGRGAVICDGELFPIGVAMCEALYKHAVSSDWLFRDKEESFKFGALLPVYQPFFPEYKRSMPEKEWTFREGIYSWRVSLAGAWREITAPDGTLLDDLAIAILDAFKFKHDHLYCFEFVQANGRKIRFACPFEEDSAYFTDEITLGDLMLPEEGVMTMIFDYGDWWEFEVKLKKVSPPDPKLKGPRVTAEKGKAPPQYHWGEDEDWEGEE